MIWPSRAGRIGVYWWEPPRSPCVNPAPLDVKKIWGVGDLNSYVQRPRLEVYQVSVTPLSYILFGVKLIKLLCVSVLLLLWLND